MNKSDTIQNLAAALSITQAEMPAAMMNAKNPFLNNKYADLGAIIETAKPIMGKHGLSVSQMVMSEDNKIGVETILMHASGEWISSTVSLDMREEKGKSAAQVAGSVITYLRRYALAAALGMYADEDTDGNAHESKREQPAQAPVPQTVVLHTEDGLPVVDANGNPDMIDLPADTHKFTVEDVWHGQDKNKVDRLKFTIVEDYALIGKKYGAVAFHVPDALKNFKEWEIDKHYKAPPSAKYVIVRDPADGGKYPEVLRFEAE